MKILDNKQKMIIYKVTNIINSKVYIGRTVGTLRYRYRKHLYDIKHRNSCPLLYNAIRKYGMINFNWETIDVANSVNELNEKEKYYIKLYNSNNKDNGYNLTEGGDGTDGYKHTEECKYNMSKIKKRQLNNNKYKQKIKENLNKYHNSRKYKLERINVILKKYNKKKENKILSIQRIEKKKLLTKERINNITTRTCPNCGKEIKYSNYYNMKDAEKKKRYCLECNIVRLKEYGRSKEFLDMMYKINNSEEHKNKIKTAMKNMSDEAYKRMIEGARKRLI